MHVRLIDPFNKVSQDRERSLKLARLLRTEKYCAIKLIRAVPKEYGRHNEAPSPYATRQTVEKPILEGHPKQVNIFACSDACDRLYDIAE